MNVNIGNIGQRYIDKIRNNKEVAMSALSGSGKEIKKVESNLPLNHPLRNKKFRQKVRAVLDYLSYDMTIGNYNHCKDIYDFEAMYDSLENPRFRARVYLICNNVNILPIGRVINDGQPERLCVDLPGRNRTIALQNISNAYEFIEWC